MLNCFDTLAEEIYTKLKKDQDRYVRIVKALTDKKHDVFLYVFKGGTLDWNIAFRAELIKLYEEGKKYKFLEKLILNHYHVHPSAFETLMEAKEIDRLESLNK